MYTGKSNNSNLNQFYSWNGKTDLNFQRSDKTWHELWGNADANHVRGSDGLGFNIDIKGYESQTILVDNLFRHVRFVANTTVSIQGIDMLAYVLDQSEFNNVSQGHPEYFLFAPSGVSNLTGANAVSQGSPVPVVTSQPLYYQSDPFYSSQVVLLDGLTPTLEDHNTFIYVEPHTGITMQARKRLQINLQMRGSFLLYPKMPTTYVPVVWFEQVASITAPLADKWRNSVGVVVALLLAVPILGFSLAGLMLLLAGSMFVLAYTRRRSSHEYGRVQSTDTIQYRSK